MTLPQQPVRAVARVTSGAPTSGAALLLPARRPDRLGPVHLLQLLLIEVAAIGVLLAAIHGLVAVAAAAIGAAALLVVALGRRGGRWWLERALMDRAFRDRKRARPGRLPEDEQLAALQVLAPGLTITDQPVADGSQVGVARDDAGWFAVAAVERAGGPAEWTAAAGGGVGERLALDVLAGVLAEAGQPGAVLQVVWHTVPAPSGEVAAQAPVSQSYRSLLAGFGPVPVPMDRATWVAVRLDARTLARSGVADPGAEAPAVVAGLLRQVGKALRRTGREWHVLDSAALVRALLRSCDLEPHKPGAVLPEPVEEWTKWHSARLAHRSFWLRSWPPVAHAAGLLDWLAAAPAAATDVALVLAPDTDGLFDLRGLVRVAAPAEVLDQLCQAVTSGAAAAKAELFPLDGEQGPAVYATAPTGGGPR